MSHSYISSKEKLPAQTHYAALVFTSVYIPGDERSVSCPGHGYPAENKPVVEYIAFPSKESMEIWVKKREAESHSREEYKIVEVRPLNIRKNIVVSFE